MTTRKKKTGFGTADASGYCEACERCASMWFRSAGQTGVVSISTQLLSRLGAALGRATWARLPFSLNLLRFSNALALPGDVTKSCRVRPRAGHNVTILPGGDRGVGSSCCHRCVCACPVLKWAE